MPIASSTCSVIDSTTTICVYYAPATSTPPVYSGVVTAGDALIALLVLFVIAIMLIVVTIKSI